MNPWQRANKTPVIRQPDPWQNEENQPGIEQALLGNRLAAVRPSLFDKPVNAVDFLFDEEGTHDPLRRLGRVTRTMPEPPPIQGAHAPSALAKVWRFLNPEGYRAYKRFIGGDYTQAGINPILGAMADLVDPDSGLPAVMPGMGGAVRWTTGVNYPTAFLHRAIGQNPRKAVKELDFWDRVFRHGGKSEAPTSVVTPSHLATFGSNPHGLLWDIVDPKDIKHAGWGDLWTLRIPGGAISESKGRRLSDTLTKLQELKKRRTLEKDPGAPLNPVDDEGTIYLDGIMPDIFKRYGAAQRAIEKRVRANQNWQWDVDSRDWALSDKMTKQVIERLMSPEESLDDLFLKQLGAARQYGQPTPTIFGDKDSYLFHNEVIPRLGKENLAGVRVPWERGDEAPDLTRALMEFAESQRVPTYKFPVVTSRAQQIQGLENPFAGIWGRPRGKDYKTSSEIGRLFGTRIGDLP